MNSISRQFNSRCAALAAFLAGVITASAQTATFTPVQPLSGDPNDVLSLNDMTSDGAVLIGVNKSFSPPGATSVLWARPADLDWRDDT